MRTAVAALVVALVAAPAAVAHEGGKAVPRLSVAVSAGDGLTRELTVEAADADGGGPIRGATVEGRATMTDPHTMTTYFGPLHETAPGRYSGALRFPMPAEWTLEITIRGPDVARATATHELAVTRANGPAAEQASLEEVQLRVEHRVTGRDVTSMAVLWLHALTALGWLLGVAAMTVALGPWPLLATGARERVRRAYTPWGAVAHWALALAVVATGVYNLLYVTPFALVWRPDELDRLDTVPYGGLYEAILAAKLALFGVVLVAGSQLLRRTLAGGRPGGLSLAAYLAAVPLLLAAAASLRYVHVLSHVAEVVEGR